MTSTQEVHQGCEGSGNTISMDGRTLHCFLKVIRPKTGWARSRATREGLTGDTATASFHTGTVPASARAVTAAAGHPENRMKVQYLNCPVSWLIR